MALNLNPYQIKQLKTLINAYADNLAAQERVLRQLIVCLGLRDEPVVYPNAEIRAINSSLAERENR